MLIKVFSVLSMLSKLPPGVCWRRGGGATGLLNKGGGGGATGFYYNIALSLTSCLSESRDANGKILQKPTDSVPQQDCEYQG